LAFWPETELSKIGRSFKLISVVWSERGSKETLGARFLAQISRKLHSFAPSRLSDFHRNLFSIPKKFIVRPAIGQSFAISACAASSS
jgi:hypothetical protein